MLNHTTRREPGRQGLKRATLYSPAGIADRLGVHRQTVIAAILAGRLKAIPIMGPDDRTVCQCATLKDAQKVWPDRVISPPR